MTEFSKIKFKNGLTFLFEKRESNVTSVVVAARTGAIHENLQDKGIAHFFEHMLFKGSKNRGQKEISKSIENVGGILNGFTAEEVTAFWSKLPSKHALIALDILSDMVLNPKFDIRELAKEKKVIVEEIKMKHDQPIQEIFDRAKECLYAKPFGLSILGSEKTISTLTRKDLLKWHLMYNPKNIIISTVGNSCFDDFIDKTKKDFGKNKKSQIKDVNIRKINNNFTEKRKNIDQTHFAIAFHASPLSQRERYATDIFNTILGRGMSSRLFQEVREKRGLAYNIHSFLEQEKSYGHCIVYAGIDKKKIKEVKNIILKEIKKLRTMSSRELDDTKEHCIGGWQVKNENSDSVAVNLLFEEIAGRAENHYGYIDKISETKLNDVRKISKLKKYSTAIILPA